MAPQFRFIPNKQMLSARGVMKFDYYYASAVIWNALPRAPGEYTIPPFCGCGRPEMEQEAARLYSGHYSITKIVQYAVHPKGQRFYRGPEPSQVLCFLPFLLFAFSSRNTCKQPGHIKRTADPTAVTHASSQKKGKGEARVPFLTNHHLDRNNSWYQETQIARLAKTGICCSSSS